MSFADRRDAGRRLARLLEAYRGTDAIVLGLPRGGVPVADEVARHLGLPLDVCIVRKLGAPMQPELGMGAIAEGDALYIDPDIVSDVGATPDEVQAIIATKREEIAARQKLFRAGRPPPRLAGRRLIVVDDGIATGGTVRAALRALKSLEPAGIVLAVPVAPADTVERLRGEVDELVCVDILNVMSSVGQSYDDFTQTEDEEVVRVLRQAHARAPDEDAFKRYLEDNELDEDDDREMKARIALVSGEGEALIDDEEPPEEL